ncbi:MAG: YceI family protein [Polaromonas sp.]|nr:YceI family protein [Polaromonas sp.]
MTFSRLLPAFLTVALATAALPATAQQKLLPAQSSIGFEIRQMGVPVQGHFKKFDAQISFDPAKLAASTVNFNVDIASTTLGAPEMDSELPKATWFNTPKFPQAQFTSSAFKALGGGKYEVTGKLAIKGQSRDVTVPLVMTQNGATTTAIGVLPIKRLAFKIGEGDWADTSMVADDVQVKFKLALSGIPKLP